ncbi:uncharacterized protein LOC111560213 isoform X7 [Felis catus]|uniref:uncharacterized protein LOC111560213 isoform X7 n=1 Tax=Felis catus TaxID=9685 RepID=UPI001D19A009|nr:uncharacterized protein LOC111560213 isoform X7 [Felis catus]
MKGAPPRHQAPAESHQWRLPERGGGAESRPGRQRWVNPEERMWRSGSPIWSQEESRLSSTGPCVPSKKSRDRTWGLTAESPWCQERRDRTRCLWSSV